MDDRLFIAAGVVVIIFSWVMYWLDGRRQD